MRYSAIAALALIGTSAYAQDVAIVGAKVVIGNGKVVNKGTILVQGGKIVSVGTNVKLPSGITTVDGTGLTAYPGFIDAYTTKGLKLPPVPDAATPPNTTITAPATMWAMNRKGVRGRVNAADCLDLAGTFADAHKAGITAGLLAPGSGIVRGRTAFAYFTDDKQAAKPEGFELSFRGTSSGGASGYAYPGTLLGYVALLRQILADAQTYSQTADAKEDLDLKGIGPLVKGEVPGIIAADSDPDIYRSFELAKEFKFSFAIYGGRDAYKRADQLAKASIPVLVNISIGSEPTATVQPDGPPQAILDERKALWNERALNVLNLVKSKVEVAFSSDASGFDEYLANIRKLIKLGLAPDAALKAMTQTPAKVFGVEKELGSLESGKVANVVLMTGDFTDEKSTVKTVLVMGKKFEVAK